MSIELAMEVVPIMEKQPGYCTLCGGCPQDDEGPLPVIDTHSEVNWGDNLYVCSECGGIIAGLLGYEMPEVVAEAKSALIAEKKAHQKTMAKLERLEDRVKTIVAGRRAVKEIKSTAGTGGRRGAS